MSDDMFKPGTADDGKFYHLLHEVMNCYLDPKGQLITSNAPDAKERLLKSLGLNWRTYPNEMPERGEIVLVGFRSPCRYRFDRNSRDTFAWMDTSGDGSYVEIQPGDRWLPLKALENLP